MMLGSMLKHEKKLCKMKKKLNDSAQLPYLSIKEPLPTADFPFMNRRNGYLSTYARGLSQHKKHYESKKTYMQSNSNTMCDFITMKCESYQKHRHRFYVESEIFNSIHSIKKCLIILIIVLLEMASQLFCRLIISDSSQWFYHAYVCKIFVAMDLVLTSAYCLKLCKAYWWLYLEGLKVQQQKYSVVVCILFDLIPHLKLMVETIYNSRLYCKYFRTKCISEAEIKKAQAKERRRNLCRPYFPSMDTDYSQYEWNIRNEPASMEPRCMSTPCKNTINPLEIDQYSPIATLGAVDAAGDSLASSRFARSDALNFTSPSSMFYQQEDCLPRAPENQNGVIAKMRTMSADEYWFTVNVDPNVVDDWIDKLKLWIHTTILNRVVQEIDVINKRLDEMGLVNIKIGESSIQTLRMLLDFQAAAQSANQAASAPGVTHQPPAVNAAAAALNSRQLPDSMPTLINFLDCCKDQVYVVNRLRELSQGLSLSRYSWNSGSTNPKHPWREHLPNDAALVLHLFTCYIDCKHSTSTASSMYSSFSQQLIVDPASIATMQRPLYSPPGNKPSSMQQQQQPVTLHHRRVSPSNQHNSSDSSLQNSCLLLQSTIQPPRFRVIIDNALIIDVTTGRTNLFECLLIFLFKVYKNETNFKWLNLGRAGLNLNWIFKQ